MSEHRSQQANDAKSNGCSAVFAVGARTELDMWPVFLMLLSLFPSQCLHIAFISPDVLTAMDTQSHTFPFSADSGCSTAADQLPATEGCTAVESCKSATARHLETADNQALAAADQAAALQENLSIDTKTLEACERSERRQQCGLQHNLGFASSSRITDLYSAKHPAHVEHGLQLSFHKGLYHEAAASVTRKHGRANLVFGANAGEQPKSDCGLLVS